MTFRARLLATLRAVEPVLAQPGVLVAGSEVPNLLEPDAASTLVVSQDVDLAVPVGAHARVKEALGRVRGLRASAEEPSVWVPSAEGLIEVNFIGYDPARRDLDATYVLDDAALPLMVFGPLSLLEPGPRVVVEPGFSVPLPRTSGLVLEKLLTDRSGEKGDRDLLVVAGLLALATDADLGEIADGFRSLPDDARYAVRSNLTTLSLLGRREAMPDPQAVRERISDLLHRLDAGEARG